MWSHFVVKTSPDAERRIQAAGLRGGVDLHKEFPELGQSQLLCVTEATPDRAIERLVEVLS